MAAIVCKTLSIAYGDVQALSDVSCELPEGEVLLVLGPSGAGKTTLLRVIAGIEKPDTGTVRIGDELMTDRNVLIPPHKRQLGFLFQRPTLWPHMTVLENVLLALSGRGLRRSERRIAARHVLAGMGMNGRAESYPGTLSGGELQRAALARALVTEPRVLLLDEPFASLDIGLRRDLLEILARLKEQHAASMIWVSHRFEDVYALADHILLLRNGRVEESGKLRQVLESPKSAFAAEFLCV